MKRFLLLIPVTGLFLVSAVFYNYVKADVGVPSSPGGSIVSGDQTDAIEMTSEKVTFDILEETNEYDYYEADVEAVFQMTNVTNTKESLDISFPIPASIVDFDGNYNDNMNFTSDVHVYVNNNEVDFEYNDYEYSTIDESFQTAVGVDLTVDFEADAVTEIKVTYNSDINYEPKSIFGGYRYIMETGSNWKGSIGEGEIIFKFPWKLTKNAFLDYDERFVIDGKEMVWSFENLEPGEEDNIEMLFAPSLLQIWNDTSNSEEGLLSSQKAGLKTTGWELVPTLVGENFSFYFLDSNELYLLQTELPTSDNYGGWFTQVNSINPPWVKYEFDAVYKMNQLKIFQGILLPGESIGGEATDSYYNVLHRPKTLKITFSDGTVKNIDLDDNPDELLTIDLGNIEASSAKVEITDVYTDSLQETTDYVGIGRMNFVLGAKVAEKDDDTDQTTTTSTISSATTTTQNQSGSSSNSTTMLIIGIGIGSGVLLFFVIIFAVLMKMRKPKKVSLKEDSEADTANVAPSSAAAVDDVKKVTPGSSPVEPK